MIGVDDLRYHFQERGVQISEAEAANLIKEVSVQPKGYFQEQTDKLIFKSGDAKRKSHGRESPSAETRRSKNSQVQSRDTHGGGEVPSVDRWMAEVSLKRYDFSSTSTTQP